jgi:hypothetical protein
MFVILPPYISCTFSLAGLPDQTNMPAFFIKVFKVLFWFNLALVFGLCLVIFVWGIQSQPVVINDVLIDQNHVKRVKHLVRQHDPRRMRIGQNKNIFINDKDINILVGFFLKNYPQLAVKTELKKNTAFVKSSINLDVAKIDGYANVTFNLADYSRQLKIENLSIGSVPVPDWLAQGLAELLHNQLMRLPQYHAAISSIQDYRIFESNLVLVYQWQLELARQVKETGKSFILSEQDSQRLIYYYNEIAELTQKLPRKTSLEKLFKPLYAETQSQTLQGYDASDENRAMLIALTFYIMGTDVHKHFNIPGNGQVKRPKRLLLTLAKRQDLAKHFVLSAGISASAGKSIADIVGLFKELEDSQGGTGFSFADLAADKAGVHLAELSVNPGTAIGIQKTMAVADNEQDFMPSINNLPEGIQELEFNTQYIAINDPAYIVVDNEIKRRIENCAAFNI